MESKSDLIVDILNHATALLHADGGSVFLKDGDHLRLAAATGTHLLMERRTTYAPASPAITFEVFRDGQPILVNDFSRDSSRHGFYDEIEHSQMEIRNLVAVPIELGDKIIGVLRCTNKTVNNANAD